ncbi:MAG: hypothetical protein FWH18_02700 [Marinilabiliaceae bacterium]|nr:hypothetical protein [Marinilabiliaceae bacterium]
MFLVIISIAKSLFSQLTTHITSYALLSLLQDYLPLSNLLRFLLICLLIGSPEKVEALYFYQKNILLLYLKQT